MIPAPSHISHPQQFEDSKLRPYALWSRDFHVILSPGTHFPTSFAWLDLSYFLRLFRPFLLQEAFPKFLGWVKWPFSGMPWHSSSLVF